MKQSNDDMEFPALIVGDDDLNSIHESSKFGQREGSLLAQLGKPSALAQCRGFALVS